MFDLLVNFGLVALILGSSALLTNLYVKHAYNRCRTCGNLNAKRRGVCRMCGRPLGKHRD